MFTSCTKKKDLAFMDRFLFMFSGNSTCPALKLGEAALIYTCPDTDSCSLQLPASCYWTGGDNRALMLLWSS